MRGAILIYRQMAIPVFQWWFWKIYTSNDLIFEPLVHFGRCYVSTHSIEYWFLLQGFLWGRSLCQWRRIRKSQVVMWEKNLKANLWASKSGTIGVSLPASRYEVATAVISECVWFERLCSAFIHLSDFSLLSNQLSPSYGWSLEADISYVVSAGAYLWVWLPLYGGVTSDRTSSRGAV